MSETLEEKYQYMCKLCEEYASRLAEKPATSIDTIVKDIEDLTDSLNTTEELKEAWRKITDALSYLSAKDNMFRYKKKKEENK